jgi:hypothetical protein
VVVVVVGFALVVRFTGSLTSSLESRSLLDELLSCSLLEDSLKLCPFLGGI